MFSNHFHRLWICVATATWIAGCHPIDKSGSAEDHVDTRIDRGADSKSKQVTPTVEIPRTAASPPRADLGDEPADVATKPAIPFQSDEEEWAILLQRFAADPVNHAWARSYTSEVQSALATALPKASLITRLECRSKMCVLEAEHSNEDDCNTLFSNLFNGIQAPLSMKMGGAGNRCVGQNPVRQTILIAHRCAPFFQELWPPEHLEHWKRKHPECQKAMP